MFNRVTQLFTSSPSRPGGDVPMFSSQFSVGQPLPASTLGEADHYPTPTSPPPRRQRTGTETSDVGEAVSPSLAAAVERINFLEATMQSTLETVKRQEGVITDLQQRLVPLEAAKTRTRVDKERTKPEQDEDVVHEQAEEGGTKGKKRTKDGAAEAQAGPAVGFTRLGSVIARTGGPISTAPQLGKPVVVRRRGSTSAAGPSRQSTSHSHSHSHKADPYITNDPLFGSLPIKYHRAYHFYYCTLCDAPVSNISKHFQTIQRNKPVHRAKVHACNELLPAALATYPESNPHERLPFPPTFDNPHPHFIPDIFAEPGYACRLCTYCMPSFPSIRSHCLAQHDITIDDEEEDPDAHPYLVMKQLQKFFTLGSWFPSTVPNPSPIPSKPRGDTKPVLHTPARPRTSTSRAVGGPGGACDSWEGG